MSFLKRVRDTRAPVGTNLINCIKNGLELLKISRDYLTFSGAPHGPFRRISVQKAYISDQFNSSKN